MGRGLELDDDVDEFVVEDWDEIELADELENEPTDAESSLKKIVFVLLDYQV